MASGNELLDNIVANLKSGKNQWRRGDNLLWAFGYRRRRQSAIDAMNEALAVRQLYTDPPLSTEMPLDKAIRFHLKDGPPEPPAIEPTPVELSEVEEPLTLEAGRPAEMSLRVGNLECAERAPHTVAPDAPVAQALTLMDLRRVSQLVVATGPRDVKGVVSYRSIARGFVLGRPEFVRDCLDTKIPRVGPDEPLLHVVGRLRDHGAVLVFGVDRAIAGMVTAADIAEEFEEMAGPFLMVGETEEQLRWLICRSLTLMEALTIAGLSDGAVHMTEKDLTLGDLQRILENPEAWARVGIQYDRATFCEELDVVRKIRNDVMHFRDSPDADAVSRLKNFGHVVQIACLSHS